VYLNFLLAGVTLRKVFVLFVLAAMQFFYIYIFYVYMYFCHFCCVWVVYTEVIGRNVFIFLLSLPVGGV
jgi:hypothetical protein